MKPLTKTTPRFPLPQSAVWMNVSVGVVEMVKTALVIVGMETEAEGAGELFQLVKLSKTAFIICEICIKKSKLTF